jgi:hypothetical protein
MFTKFNTTTNPTTTASVTATPSFELSAEQMQQVTQLQEQIAQHTAHAAACERQLAQIKTETHNYKAAISTATRAIDAITSRRDSELESLLTAKLPNVNRGIECCVDLTTQKLNIYLISCMPEEVTNVNTFFCAFLNDDDFLTRDAVGGDYGINVAFNQPIISVQLPLADREKLVNGLKLANAAPKISATTLTARC